ncbi:MAG: GDSL-type esterase/lipase family protein [Clostridia bacterium]|nr:GDSL-type esterase/lipase family protein [Clostridia bacterium]
MTWLWIIIFACVLAGCGTGTGESPVGAPVSMSAGQGLETLEAVTELPPDPLCLVFLGDSITAYCDLPAYYPGFVTVNGGIPGDTAEGLYGRWRESFQGITPDGILVHIGINDLLLGHGETETIDTIRLMLEDIKCSYPGAGLYLQSLYPLCDSPALTLTGHIRSVNAELKAMADELGIVYINMFDILAEDDGRLPEDYTFDGIHPNGTAYQIISASLIGIIRENT